MSAGSGAVEVASPENVEQALALLASDERWLPLAGGTDLLARLDALPGHAARVLSLRGMRRELRYLAVDERGLRVGALATLLDLARASGLQERVPLLAQAAAALALPAVQSLATVGGHLASASPSGDLLPVWSALDAEVELRSSRGARRVPFASWCVGYRRTDRRPDELITGVRAALPPARSRQVFRKYPLEGARRTSRLVFAGVLDTDRGIVRHVRLSFGAVGVVPFRARGTESALLGARLVPGLVQRAGEVLRKELRPEADFHVTVEERLALAETSLADLVGSGG